MMLSEEEIKKRKAAYDKAWREANIEKIKAHRSSEEYKAHRRATRDLEKERVACRDYYQRNVEYMRARAKKYSKENPDIVKANSRKYYEKSGKERGLRKIKQLSDSYIKCLLIQDTTLKCKDIPQEMVDAKRLEIMIKRKYYAEVPKAVRDKANGERSRRKLGMQPRKPATPKEVMRERHNKTAREKYDPDLARKKRQEALDKETPEQKEARLKRQRAYNLKYKDKHNEKRRNRSPEERERVNALARAAVARRKLKQGEQNEKRN